MATNASARIAPGGRERQAQAEGSIQPLAEQPATSEGGEQRDATDHRWQHDRQQREGAQQRAAAKDQPRLHPRQRQAEDHREGSRRQRAEQREAQRGGHLRRRQRRAEPGPRGAPDQPEQRQNEEQRGARCADERQNRNRLPALSGRRTRAVHGGGKPNDAKIWRACPERTKATNAVALLSPVAPVTTPIG